MDSYISRCPRSARSAGKQCWGLGVVVGERGGNSWLTLPNHQSQIVRQTGSLSHPGRLRGAGLFTPDWAGPSILMDVCFAQSLCGVSRRAASTANEISWRSSGGRAVDPPV